MTERPADRDAAVEAMAACLHSKAAAEGRIKELEKLLVRILPECFVCRTHGTFVKVDEDGCCVFCGSDTYVKSSAEMLPLYLREHD